MPWKHGEVKVELISCAAKVQHCQETDRHTAVTDVCPDSQRFHLTWFGKRGVAENIRFDSFIDDLSSVDSKGLNFPDCEVLVRINKQSPDIAGNVHVGMDDLDVGAGDQGIKFGYAGDETEDAMPHTHTPWQRSKPTLAKPTLAKPTLAKPTANDAIVRHI